MRIRGIKMTKDVLVHVKGLQFEESEHARTASPEDLEKIETISPGEYYYRNNAHYVLYSEIIEGFDEQVKNTFKLRENEFTITKKGPVNVQMVFCEGKKVMTDYYTPFGNIMLALDTKKIETLRTDDSISVHISYGLEANYQFVADCEIDIRVESRECAQK